MHAYLTPLVITAAIALIVLVVAPLRHLVATITPPLFERLVRLTRMLLHILVGAHVNVLNNLMPRVRVLYELDNKRTSHTNEH